MFVVEGIGFTLQLLILKYGMECVQLDHEEYECKNFERICLIRKGGHYCASHEDYEELE